MTNELKGQILVVVNEEVIGHAEDYNDIEMILNAYANDSTKDIDNIFNGDGVRLYNTVGPSVSSNDGDFHIIVKRDNPYLGDAYEDEDASPESYYVSDLNRTFSDEDELRDFLMKIIKSEEYTLEEVKAFDITVQYEKNVSFDDAELGDIQTEIKFTVNGNVSFDKYFAERYILASDVPELPKSQEPEPLDPEEMTLGELYTQRNNLANELAKLDVLIQERVLEKEHRASQAVALYEETYGEPTPKTADQVLDDAIRDTNRIIACNQTIDVELKAVEDNIL